MSIVVDAVVVAQLAPPTISLRPLFGCYEVGFSFVGALSPVSGEGQRRYVIHGATVRVAPPGQSVEMGFARPNLPVVIQPGIGVPQPHFSMSLVLTPAQIELLEKTRDGGDLAFALQIRGLATSSRAPGYVDVPEVQNPDIYAAVARSDWVKQFNAAGIDQIILSEIRIHGIGGSTIKHPGSRHLASAYGNYLNGDWNGCVVECRRAAQALGGGKLGKIKGEFAKAGGLMPKADREIMLLAAIEHYCHPAAHPQNADAPGEFCREDAKLVLAMTASYTTRIGEHDA